jgi:outer membrane lipoprotein SlyB
VGLMVGIQSAFASARLSEPVEVGTTVTSHPVKIVGEPVGRFKVGLFEGLKVVEPFVGSIVGFFMGSTVGFVKGLS